MIPPLKNHRLQAGDIIGIIAPGSPIDRQALEDGCDGLRAMGYKPEYDESILEADGFFAGSVQRRVRELHEMFARDDVRAIICARGGYGCNHLLPEIDLDIVRQHPKVFAGYSDVTTLQTWFHDQAGLVSLHGPMVTKDWSRKGWAGVDLSSWHNAVSCPSGETGEGYEIENDAEGLVPGEAEGVVYGGCLTLLAASLGTPYEIQTPDAILFVEDTATKPYQVDRLLMQLKLGGKLSAIKGIIFGEMLNCVQNPRQDYTLQQVVTRVVGDLGIPVAYGLRSGHVSRANITLPIGMRARMAVKDGLQLNILEAPCR